MTLQYSVAVNNAKLDQIEATIGTAPLLKLYTGSIPANPAAAATGTLLATLTLPSDWMAAAASASKAKAGTWSGTASASGTCGYCRIYDSTGTNCGIQGTAGISSGDFQFDNTNISTSQSVSCTTFTISVAAANT